MVNKTTNPDITVEISRVPIPAGTRLRANARNLLVRLSNRLRSIR